MPEAEQRRHADRRRQPRGGRRSTDAEGFAPLVFVIGGEPAARDTCEAILAKLRFAVAPFSSVEAALAVINDLRPEVIVASELEQERLRGRLSSFRPVPIVPLAELAQPESIVEAIRNALRASPPATNLD